MATSLKAPLLLQYSSQIKSSHCKSLYLVIFLAAIVIPITLYLVIPQIKTISSTVPPQPGHVMMQMEDVDQLQGFLKESMSDLQGVMEMAVDVKRRMNDHRHRDEAGPPLADCVELMDLSMGRIGDSIEVLGRGTEEVQYAHADAHAWLSGVLTNYVTCFDGMMMSIGTSRNNYSAALERGLKQLISRAETSLAMLVAISPKAKADVLQPLVLPLQSDQLLPPWILDSRDDRKLLESSSKDIKANVVVAKDGSGNYKTVKDAIAAVPKNSKARYVIYVKKGIYKENVEIVAAQKNVMILGDGMDSTVITGSLNVIDGSTTFKSATVAAVGDGFIAQDIWFQNTAGPQKHQAVALRVGADQAVINRCRIDAYQDTLYAHSNRQFYRDCYITGTVDFIFGNAAVVFQNCKIVARKPMSSQSNMVTAQGRTSPFQSTGTSIQNCNIIPSSDLEPLKATIKTYLGRPWKEYSRTVVMQSYIGAHIQPAGWSVWDGDFALKTLYYGEYVNRGPGAGTGQRVKWPGYRLITSPAEAKKFTVAELIQGGTWLQSTGVAYTEGL